MSNQFGLLRQRRFLPFFGTQFLGAFNDNVFKTALITMVSFHAVSLAGFNGKQLATILPGLFILPYFLFSATAGQLADKYDKGKMIRAIKVLEILIMGVAAWGFMADILWLLVFSLFMMGVHSTLFGPVKYSYLPQHLGEHELVGGNGVVEMGTFVAILLGEVVGAAIMAGNSAAHPAALLVLALAVLGWLTSLGIPISPAPEPKLKVGWNPITETFRNIGFAHRNHAVWLSLLGISWFWFYGATLLAQFPNLAVEVLTSSENVFILLLGVFSVGTGFGSLLCEKLSRGHVEIGLVPFAAIGLTVFGVDLYYAIPTVPLAPHARIGEFLSHAAHWRMLVDIALIGISGGLYIVPLYSMVQTRAEKSHQARIMAANNILNSAFMVASAAMSLAMFHFNFNIPQIFLATALINALVALYIYTLLPEFLMRFLVWIAVSIMYRVQRTGIQHLPKDGAALLVSNHVSYIDALVILACSPRPVRFVLDSHSFRVPLLSFIFRHNKAIVIPLADRKNPEMMAKARREISIALAEGDLVALFPEVRITADGELEPFRDSIMEILARAHVPVIPMALRGLWGSFFSRKDGRTLRDPLRRGFSNAVELVVDAAIPADQITKEALTERLSSLRGDRK